MDRLHDEGVLLPDVLSNQAVGSHDQPGRCDFLRIFHDLVSACVSMVLASGYISSDGARYIVLVYSGMFGGGQYAL